MTETGDTLATQGAAAPPAAAGVPGAVAAGRHRTGLQAGPRQDGPGPRSGCSRRSRRPASSARDTGEQVLRTMGEAHTAVIIERLKRKFGAAIATHTPKVPVQGDDPRHDQGPRPLQEADRRARHVRRRLAGARAQPGRRRRVRREGRRRVGAEGLLRRRREGRPRGRRRGRARRLSALRLQGDALRRLVPPGRLERAVVQDRRVDGRSRTASTRRSRRCSSRS